MPRDGLRLEPMALDCGDHLVDSRPPCKRRTFISWGSVPALVMSSSASPAIVSGRLVELLPIRSMPQMTNVRPLASLARRSRALLSGWRGLSLSAVRLHAMDGASFGAGPCLSRSGWQA